MDEAELKNVMKDLHNRLVRAKTAQWKEYSLNQREIEAVIAALEIAGEV
jgi:hypothetical protein